MTTSIVPDLSGLRFATAARIPQLLLPTLQAVQRHPRICTTPRSLSELPYFTDFSIWSSLIMFAFTAYNTSAWARSLERCGVLYGFAGFTAEAGLYSMTCCEKISIGTPLAFNTQHSFFSNLQPISPFDT